MSIKFKIQWTDWKGQCLSGTFDDIIVKKNLNCVGCFMFGLFGLGLFCLFVSAMRSR